MPWSVHGARGLSTWSVHGACLPCLLLSSLRHPQDCCDSHVLPSALQTAWKCPPGRVPAHVPLMLSVSTALGHWRLCQRHLTPLDRRPFEGRAGRALAPTCTQGSADRSAFCKFSATAWGLSMHISAVRATTYLLPRDSLETTTKVCPNHLLLLSGRTQLK